MLALCGLAAVLRSWPHAAWAATFVLLNLIWIPWRKEPGLERRFGEEYRRYKRSVPRLIPRRRPWKPRTMVDNPPAGCQRVIPYLYYEDAPAAVDFLTRAFGFEERFAMPADDGRLMHAELGFGDNVLMLASVIPDRQMAPAGALPARHGLVMVYVDDVDGHHERAAAAGAQITAPLETRPYGDRMYGATDPEGHQWYFATHVEDVAPEDMGPPEA